MFSVRFHGRGGQGVVTAAEMLSVAAFDTGLHAQAFPTFGSERMGAPVMSFCRFDDRPITFHEPIAEPDCLVIQDATLLGHVPLFDGAGPATFVLVNSSRTIAELGLASYVAHVDPARVATVPATELARQVLGRPVPNTALLGAFSALTGLLPIEAVTEAILQRFPGDVGDRNVEVAVLAHSLLADRVSAPSRTRGARDA